MRSKETIRLPLMLITALFLSMQGNPTHASEPTLLYAGAAAGQSRLDGSEDFAWAALIGTRPLTALGAELQYVNLGATSSSVSVQTPYPATVRRDAQARGVAAFAVAYIPLLSGNFDIDVKAGLSRLNDTQFRSYTPIPIDTCLLLPLPPDPACGSHVHQTNVNFAWGAGVQAHISHVLLRADFERFVLVGNHPSILSLGVAWAFF
jgi:hypothetical protein